MDKVGDHSAVVGSHAGAIGIENADDAGIDAPVTVVGHGDRFSVSFRLVVAAANPDGVHVPPVRFRLRVHQRVAVDFAGAGQHELRTVAVR